MKLRQTSFQKNCIIRVLFESSKIILEHAMKFPRNIQLLLLQEKVCAFREFQKNAQILEGAVKRAII